MATKVREDRETVRLTGDVVLFGQDPADGHALHVLLIKRGWDPFEGHWALPGGHVDPGEDVKAAARRELQEEAGVNLGLGMMEPVGVYSTPGRDPRGRYVTFAYTFVLAVLQEPFPDDDATDARWFPVAEVFDLPLAFDHGQIIRDALPVAQRTL